MSSEQFLTPDGSKANSTLFELCLLAVYRMWFLCCKACFVEKVQKFLLLLAKMMSNLYVMQHICDILSKIIWIVYRIALPLHQEPKQSFYLKIFYL